MTAANRLSDSDAAYLDSMVSLEEIKNAVWDCGSQKAPGPDVFLLCLSKSTGIFYISTFRTLWLLFSLQGGFHQV